MQKSPVVGLLVILLLVSLASSVYFFLQWKEAVANPQKITQQETEELIARVGELMVLPEDEQPTIATVNDPEVLKEQAFFAKAKKGDKVLIYTTAKKAILYDPVNHKIVEVAPVNIGDSQTPTQNTESDTDTE